MIVEPLLQGWPQLNFSTPEPEGLKYEGNKWLAQLEETLAVS